MKWQGGKLSFLTQPATRHVLLFENTGQIELISKMHIIYQQHKSAVRGMVQRYLHKRRKQSESRLHCQSSCLRVVLYLSVSKHIWLPPKSFIYLPLVSIFLSHSTSCNFTVKTSQLNNNNN